MKVIFIASLYDKQVRQDNYSAIIKLLKSLDHQVFHSHVTDFEIQQVTSSLVTNDQFHQAIFRALYEADLVVAEITGQSLGVGFILAEALKERKPVLALTTQQTPPLATFLENQQNLVVHHYVGVGELDRKLPFLISQLEPQKPKKFNLFLPYAQDRYLSSVAQKNQLSKSEYLRQLIHQDQNSRL